GERQRRRAADAPGRPRDECDLALQVAHPRALPSRRRGRQTGRPPLLLRGDPVKLVARENTMRTRDLLNLKNTGHPGINALFAKAHSADWDYERDLDWSIAIDPEDPLVDESWTAFGATPTFATLPEQARRYVTRRALGRMLNILQVGESVAQNVCAKLVLTL